ncbi:hypothetical protein Aple_086150 [Acrocarpospora pleiomorpha]|uniref:Uncharacterized protein n=1 Tax=Acrocarpospora pleiomorpha TaxID=90975 RepID=A0A5M3XXW1_9ACTN|nr:hypothetical protein [Acrocarpospora pleiomorpha]GES25716.1 hypothetical protein Aple_086150 [Acrocarpospora pleiomorpha]
MTQDNRPQSWRPTAAERDTWTRDVFRAAAGLIAGPGGFILYLAGEYLYDRRHLLFETGGAPLRAMNPEGESIALRGGFTSVNAVPLLGGGSQGTRVLSVTPSLTASTRAMGLRDGDPVSVALSSRTVSSTRSGLIVPARIGTTTRITVPADDYSVAALGARTSALFTSKDPVIGTGTGTVSGLAEPPFQRMRPTPGGLWLAPETARQVNVPLIGRTPFPSPRQPNPLTAPRCPWCGQTVTGSVLNAMLTCPKKPGVAAVLAAFQPRTVARPARQYCADCHRYVTYREDHSLWCRFMTFLDEF